MKQIAVHDLREGLVFSHPIYIEKTSMVVPAGMAVRQKDIDRLQDWGIEVVETEGAPLGEDLAERPSPPLNQDTSAISNAERAAMRDDPKKILSLADVKEPSGSYRNYTGLISWLARVFSYISRKVPMDIRFIDGITQRILKTVREERDGFITYILGGEVRGHEFAKSSVNTAILCAHIAMEMKFPNHRIIQTITGALLHDVGMLRLPPDLINKTGNLSKEELHHIQSHTLYSYKIVHEELAYPEEMGALVLQHHENWDGSGYPQGLAGEEIHFGARIVSVADAFEAMVSQKPYRNSMLGYQAMKNLLADNSRRFGPDELNAFIKIMGVYPIGSIILLNNGSMARVVEVRKDAPLRPKIAVLVDATGKVYKQSQEELIDLLNEKNLFIVRAINPKELTKDAI
ncbi:HD-GYP domain-containing protein [Treponema primitia]|uniref:HD-GYP domain-containing protein n=1 Tax=Treponema primitia TaxID=88058 RepID=UPI00397F7C67